MKRHNIDAILLAWILSLGTITAQSVRKDSATINKELYLQQDFTPVVKDATKINQTPQIESVEIKQHKIEYVSLGLTPSLRPYPSVVDRVFFQTQSSHIDQLGYVRFGIGAYLNMEMAAGLSLIKDKKQSLLLSYDGGVFNGNRKIVQLDTSKKFHDRYHHVMLDWKTQTKSFEMNASMTYRHSGFNFIRYDDFDDQNPASNESNSYLEHTQYNNQLAIHWGLSPIKKEIIQWGLSAEYGLFDKSISEYVSEGGVSEHRIRLKGNVLHRLNEQWEVGGDLSIQSYLYSKNVTIVDSFSNLDSRTRFTLAPKAQYKNYGLTANLGFRLDPIVSTKNKVFLSPDILLAYRLNRDNLIEVSLRGDVIDNDFEYAHRVYRYLNPNIRLSEVHRPYIATLGYRTNFLDLLNIHLSASSFREREAHFLGVANGTSSLVDLFRRDITGNKLEVELFYNFSNKGSLRILANKTFWSLNDQALERPGFQFLVDAHYKLIDRLNISLSYNLMGDRHGYNWITQQIEYIRPINNLSLSANYKIKKEINVFLKGDNLLFQSYDTILGLPVQGATIMIGASYIF